MPRIALCLLVAPFLAAGCGGVRESSEEAPQRTVTTAAVAPGGSSPTVSPAAGAAIPGGGLSVQQALESPLRGPLMVQGHLFVTPDGAVLCSRIVPTDPPSCGPPSLWLIGLTDENLAREATASVGAFRWSAEAVSLLGEVTDGEFRVEPNALG